MSRHITEKLETNSAAPNSAARNQEHEQPEEVCSNHQPALVVLLLDPTADDQR
jgi:hypothetical protein